jgi:UDP-N-acetyl-2-amino-2-deoxyglucuronate dehydrogenase
MDIAIGLTGGGNITETHARAVCAIPGTRVAAINGTNPEKIANLCREYGGTPYVEFEEFLRHRPLNVVVLGSPSGLHAEQGIAAAQHGLHVLTEKPMDISTARADLLIEAARQADVKFGVIFQERLKPEIQQLKKWIAGGVLGDPIFVDARVKWWRPPEYYANSRWRGTLAMDGGGALINQGIHTVDLLLWLLGDVKRVQAWTGRLLHKLEGEDTATALLEFASGARGVLSVTTAAYPGYPRRLEITGTLGTVCLEQDRIIAADLRGASPINADAAPRGDDQRSSSPTVSDFRGHQAVIEDFLRAIRDNRAPVCDGAEGRRSVALVEAIYAAAKAPAKALTPPL